MMIEEKNDKLLQIKNLVVHYETDDGVVYAINDVSFDLKAGETLGLVGETGAGKTTIAKCILKLLPTPPASIKSGEIIFQGTDILKLDDKKLRKLRGNIISMIFQDPMSALNPVYTVGDQILEVINLHQKPPKNEAVQRAMQMLETVGIPRERFFDYPHQFSGGMKQRVVIAIAIACNPVLLLADEPTTALDVTIQAQVLDLMQKLKQELNTSMIMITHDLGVVAKSCDHVAIIYAGNVVEYGTKVQVFLNARHPYTCGLFNSLPSLTSKERRLKPIPGLMPDPRNLPRGCPFHPRCSNATEECTKSLIKMTEVEPGHTIRCINPMRKVGDEE